MIFDFLNNAFYFLLALGILVAFHEFGHYWVALKCGVKVEKFSIGFGRAFYRWQRGETEFVLGIIPLGGYVKMLGDHSNQDADQEKLADGDTSEDYSRSFDRQSVWKRIAIVAAGPIANFLLAVVFFWILALAGKTAIEPVIAEPSYGSIAQQAGLKATDRIVSVDGVAVDSWSDLYMRLIERIGNSGTIELQVRPFDSDQPTRSIELPIDKWLSDEQLPRPLDDLGLSLYYPDASVTIVQVLDDGVAAQSGLQAGDQIISVNQQAIGNWLEWRDWIRASANQPLTIEVLRNQAEIIVLELTPKRHIEEDGNIIGTVGVMGQSPRVAEFMLKEIRYNALQAIVVAVNDSYQAIHFTLVSIKKLIAGQLSPKTLGGPVSIAQYAGDSASLGWQPFVKLLALLSISLGVLNLLPIPALDGGRLLFYSYEVIVRKPLPRQVQEYALRVGIVMIGCLMLFALFNDITRI